MEIYGLNILLFYKRKKINQHNRIGKNNKFVKNNNNEDKEEVESERKGKTFIVKLLILVWRPSYMIAQDYAPMRRYSPF